MTIYCPVCEAANHDDADFCSMCGKRLAEPPTSSPPHAEMTRAARYDGLSVRKQRGGVEAETRLKAGLAVAASILFLWIVVLAPTCRWLTEDEPSTESLRREAQPVDPVAARRLLAELERKVDLLKSSGFITWMSVDFNEARVDLTTWLLLDVGKKQSVVMLLSRYCEAMESTGRVKIMSNLNDEELATYSVWTGIKIKR